MSPLTLPQSFFYGNSCAFHPGIGPDKLLIWGASSSTNRELPSFDPLGVLLRLIGIDTIPASDVCKNDEVLR